MSKHDTWVKLKKGHPLQHIEHLFPEGFPMRDPFAMGLNTEGDTCLWFMDSDRLDSNQINHLASILAEKFDVSVEQVIQEMAGGCFPINANWIESMSGGAENYSRTIELINFLEAHPEFNGDDLLKFHKQQKRDWLDRDKVPETMTENYEDIDPRLKSPALEEAYQQIQNKKSLLDLLHGKY